jgi:hypothetical protein
MLVVVGLSATTGISVLRRMEDAAIVKAFHYSKHPLRNMESSSSSSDGPNRAEKFVIVSSTDTTAIGAANTGQKN